MRHLRLAAIVLALLLLPSAGAGSERSPEFSSPADRSIPAGDLLAVWFENDPDGLLITFKSAQLGERHSSLVYYVVMDVHDIVVSPGVGYDTQGLLRTDSGANPAGWGNGRVDDLPSIMNVQTGSPGYLSILIPWGMYGLDKDSHVHPLRAASSLCCDRARGGGWYTPYDEAGATVDQFDVAPPTALSAMTGFFPILVPAWMLPTIVLLCTLAGLGGGLLAARRAAHKAAALAAMPKTVPVRAAPPPPPPGERFQRAPPPAKR